MGDSWYALYVKPRFERYVETHLTRKGYEVFLPTYSSASRQTEDRSLSLPLFPGYVFCRFDLASREPILLTPGASHIVGAGREPVPVDETELRTVQRVIESRIATCPWPYVQGEMTQVVTGPLEGLRGIVLRKKGQDRLIVSVSLLKQSVSVKIDRRWLTPTDKSTFLGMLGSELRNRVS